MMKIHIWQWWITVDNNLGKLNCSSIIQIHAANLYIYYFMMLMTYPHTDIPKGGGGPATEQASGLLYIGVGHRGAALG